ncbi:YdiU family protein [Corynebacterium sp. UMB9976]|uniref:protein adenylyltransferase SelO n=1 Tax=unclassified Corynebacterium TaxID=2624378 RepID=UPI00254BCC2B|nr:MULTISPECIES: YdiU family protein [unclassified Corynebacterium]MDK6301274.1 YdiU family protein [Corynebacterium sp. UMB9976]MDK8790420.1 YdiU family protein [Corynebacterium sp. MSK039]
MCFRNSSEAAAPSGHHPHDGATGSPTLEYNFAHQLPELTAPYEPATPLPGARILVLNEPLAAELGLNADWLGSPAGVQFLLGRGTDSEARPVAQFYAGHQFGSFNPQMGDGRAVLLGERRTPDTDELLDLHVKGAGTTAYSRPGSDGKAPLTAALREFLLSEFMHAVGVPTARSLAVLTTGEQVRRHRTEPAAAIVRVATSHLRVGTFQAARMRDPENASSLLRRVADMAIQRHFPELAELSAPERYLELYRHVAAAQARLIAQWMRLGFVHGVMNTDNTAIGGFTLDYGPAAFLDRFDPQAVFSSIDAHGRYAFGNQPAIGGWNLARLAEAMLPLLTPAPGMDAAEANRIAVAAAQDVLDEYSAIYRHALDAEFADALGLDAQQPSHQHVLSEFQVLAEEHQLDVAQVLRQLTDTDANPAGLGSQAWHDTWSANGALGDNRAALRDLSHWCEQWSGAQPDRELMARINPVYYPRNAHVEEALAAALGGDYAPFEQLWDALRAPFTRRVVLERWEKPTPSPTGFRTVCGT